MVRRMRVAKCLAAVVIICRCATLVVAQSSGSVRGKIVDENQQPITSAYIIANPTSVGVPAARAAVSSDGSFVVSGLVAGTYSICVQAQDTSFLDPCHWGNPPQVKVTAGQSVTLQPLSVLKGSQLQVRLNDPTQQLARAPDPKALRTVIMGIWNSSSLLYRPTLTSVDQGGREFQLSIPYNVPLRFFIVGPGLKMVDENGNAVLGKGSTTSVQHQKNGSHKTLVFTVQGAS